MKLEHIKIGETYKIIGGKCGCCGTKCRDCKHFQEHLIKVIGIKPSFMGQCILGMWEHKSNHCAFCPEDLEPLKINWRKRLTK